MSQDDKTPNNMNFNFNNSEFKNTQFGNNNTMNVNQSGQSVSQNDAIPVPDLGVAATSADVFISYSRRDWDNFVYPFIQTLQDNNIAFFLDKRDIQVGDSWRDVINNALVNCETMLLFLSPDALNSEYVKYEYRYFAQNPDKHLLPIMCRPSTLPPELAGYQYIDYQAQQKILDRLANLT